MYQNTYKPGRRDLWNAIKKRDLILMLGYHEIRQRYQRSLLGPFWITISMGVMIGSIGLIFGRVFQSDIVEFLPFLAAGLIVWTFISSTVTDSCVAYIADARLITQISLPFSFYVLKCIYRNFLILMHNLIIIPILMILFMQTPSIYNFLFVPGILLVIANINWIAMVIAIICTRYRDMQQIIMSILQVLFYISPIIWSPSLLMESGRSVILDYNPIYYMLEVTRSPLIGQAPSVASWIVVSLSAILGNCFGIYVLGRYKSKISYWI